jgi:hypothetical protein
VGGDEQDPDADSQPVDQFGQSGGAALLCEGGEKCAEYEKKEGREDPRHHGSG